MARCMGALLASGTGGISGVVFALALGIVAAAGAAPEEQESKPWNGFDLAKASVPRDKVLAGGPPRDAIHSVDEPEFADPTTAERWVAPDSTVIGLSLGGFAHAYPVHLLEYHQVVNDELAGVPVVVSYDPLTGVPLAHKRSVDGRSLEFGVSGLVYQSNFLLYDRQTQSLWLQWTGECIAGPMLGKRLPRLRVRQEPFAAWRHRHPATRVLARPMLKQIDYRYSPYSSYWGSETIPFPVDIVDSTYHPKEVVVGLRADGKSRVYLGSVMVEAGGRVVDDFAGRKVRVAYDTSTGTFSWQIPDDVEVTEAYWFAWKAFHPEAEIWQGLEQTPAPSLPAPESETPSTGARTGTDRRP